MIHQTSKDFEYIIIDGASADESVDIIKEYSDKIDHWISEPDKGIYNAMNKGIKIAKGIYCQFLNSGDYLISSNTTREFLDLLPEDCDIFYGNLIKKLKKGYYRSRGFAGKKITLVDLFTSTISHASCYIKKELFKTYGLYDESLKVVSDWKFFFHTVGLGDIVPYYAYYDVAVFDSSGISSQNHTLGMEERTRVLRDLLPEKIYEDYAEHAKTLRQLQQITKYRGLKVLYHLLERIAFQLEKRHLKKYYFRTLNNTSEDNLLTEKK